MFPFSYHFLFRKNPLEVACWVVKKKKIKSEIDLAYIHVITIKFIRKVTHTLKFCDF